MMTAIIKRQQAWLYTQKAKKLRNIFIYIKQDTFQKSTQFPLRFNIQKAGHLTLRDFHEMFEGRIYIQNAWHFALRNALYPKKLDTLQKERKLVICFIYKNPALLCYAIFIDFWNLRRGGVIYSLIYNVLCEVFLYWKTLHFALRWFIKRAWHYALHFNTQKTIHFALQLYIYFF